MGVAIVAGIAYLVWNAARSNEFIIDLFSVPPDLAEKGISGDELAGELVDHLLTMQAQTESFRAPQSYTDNFGENIKLEIPETGISLTELDRFLREKLGNEVHISGALFHTASGLKLTARAGAAAGVTVDGSENDLEKTTPAGG